MYGNKNLERNCGVRKRIKRKQRKKNDGGMYVQREKEMALGARIYQRDGRGKKVLKNITRAN